MLWVCRHGDEALSGMSHFRKVVEDVIIYNQDIKSHVNSVREALQPCAAAGITLPKEKFVFAKQEVDYCGFTISPSGYRPDDRLIKALTEFPTPQNRTDVRSFCGLAQQFEPFTPWLTEVLAPIRCLLSPKAEFVWETVHQKPFESAIRELTSPSVLATYGGQSHLRLETDAAQSTGLGMAWHYGKNTLTVMAQVGGCYNVACVAHQKQKHVTPPQILNYWRYCGLARKRLFFCPGTISRL